jgi:hypothetical protein
MSTTQPLDRIGVDIDTARYGHRVSFLRSDRLPAAKPRPSWRISKAMALTGSCTVGQLSGFALFDNGTDALQVADRISYDQLMIRP